MTSLTTKINHKSTHRSTPSLHSGFYKIIASIALLTLLFSCGGLKKYKSPNFSELVSAREKYLAQNYKECVDIYGELIKDENATGDTLYYYGFSISRVNDNFSLGIPYYIKAIKWFEKYKSEFPQDDNRNKAIYNLGVGYYSPPNRDLQKVKKFWDIGLKLNPKNQYILNEYNNLLLQLEYIEIAANYKNLMEEIENSADKSKIEAIAEKYRVKFENKPIGEIVKVVSVTKEQTRLLLEMSENYSKFVNKLKSGFNTSL